MLYKPVAWFPQRSVCVTLGRLHEQSGRYRALTRPINGATAASCSPYFRGNKPAQPGLEIYQWDSQIIVHTPKTGLYLVGRRHVPASTFPTGRARAASRLPAATTLTASCVGGPRQFPSHRSVQPVYGFPRSSHSRSHPGWRRDVSSSDGSGESGKVQDQERGWPFAFSVLVVLTF